jgi:hypothetical protein
MDGPFSLSRLQGACPRTTARASSAFHGRQLRSWSSAHHSVRWVCGRMPPRRSDNDGAVWKDSGEGWPGDQSVRLGLDAASPPTTIPTAAATAIMSKNRCLHSVMVLYKDGNVHGLSIYPGYTAAPGHDAGQGLSHLMGSATISDECATIGSPRWVLSRSAWPSSSCGTFFKAVPC